MKSYVLKNGAATLSIEFSAGAADTDVAVVVTDAEDVEVVAGDATHDGAGGRYEFTLPPQPQVASLRVLWTGAWDSVQQSAETFVEIVGAQLFSLAELRGFGDEKLTSTAFTDEMLSEKRSEVTEFFEDVDDVSFVPRYGREILDGSGTSELRTAHRRVANLFGVTVAGAALTEDELADLEVYTTSVVKPNGRWRKTGRREILLRYQHGWDMPPARIRYAALVLARHELVTRDISDRMISFSNELGTVRLSVPGRAYPTGIPVVDQALEWYSERASYGSVALR